MTKQLQLELMKIGLKTLIKSMNKSKKGEKGIKTRHKRFAKTMVKKWDRKRAE